MWAPGLLRAVANCTQPQGPPADGEVLRKLQRYLSDDRCKDTVYRALIDRACAEPRSDAVVAKCVALLKQFIPRYPPDADNLEAVEELCVLYHAKLQPNANGLKASLAYLRSTVQRIRARAGDEQASGLIPSRGPTRNSFGGFGHPPGANHTAPVGGDGVGLLNARPLQIPKHGLGRYSPGGSESGSEPSDAGGERNSGADGGALFVPVGNAHGAGVPPPWALPSDTAESLFGLSDAAYSSPEDWSARVPEYHPSLAALRNIVDGSSIDHHAAGCSTSSHDIVDSLLDRDAARMAQHVADIAANCRSAPAVASSSSKSKSAAAAAAAAAAAQRPRQGALFQHLPYIQQDPLQLSPAEVALAVTVVCGRQAASATWDPAAQSAAAAAAEEQGLSDAAVWTPSGSGPSFGQVCSSIVLKLVLDLYLRTSAARSYLLVLRMLQKALHHGTDADAARAFDLLYNLSLHAAILTESGDQEQVPDDTASENVFPSGGGFASAQSTPVPFHVAGTPSGATATTPRASLMGTLNSPLPPSPHGMGVPSPKAPPGPGRGPWTPAGGGNGPAQESSAASPPGVWSHANDTHRHNRQQWPQRRGTSGGQFELSAVGDGEGEGGLPPPAPEALQAWLRALLFDLLAMLAKLGPRAEDVWLAATGTLLQLTTLGGHFVAAHIRPLPPAAAAALLRSAATFGWAPELHCQLTQLAVALLYSNNEGRETPNASTTGREAGAAARATLDPQRLEMFGGLQQLLRHFLAAPAGRTRRTLLAALLHAALPEGTLSETVAAAVQAVCCSDAATLAMQTALTAALPGTGDALCRAITSCHPDVEAAPLLEALRLLEQASGMGSHGSSSAVRSSGAGSLSGGCAGGGNDGGTVIAPVLVVGVEAALRHTFSSTAGAAADAATTASGSAAGGAADLQALKELARCQQPSARRLAVTWVQGLLELALDESTGLSPLPSPIALPTAAGDVDGRSTVAPLTAAIAEAVQQLLSTGPEAAHVLLDAVAAMLVGLKKRAVAAATERAAGASIINGGGSARQSAEHVGARQRLVTAARTAAATWAAEVEWVLHCRPTPSSAVHIRLATAGLDMLWSAPAHRLPPHVHPSSGNRSPAPGQLAAAGGADNAAAAAGVASVEERRISDSCSMSSVDAFLRGQLLLPDELSSLLSPGHLAALLHRLTQCKQPGGAAARGVRGQAGATAAVGGADADGNNRRQLPEDAAPAPWHATPAASATAASLLLLPWRDALQDTQLAVLLMLIGACGLERGSGSGSASDAGIEALMTQLLGSSTDVRQRYVVGGYLLKQLMLYRQGRYWQSLKGVLEQAQQSNDEGMLANPYLQVANMLRVP